MAESRDGGSNHGGGGGGGNNAAHTALVGGVGNASSIAVDNSTSASAVAEDCRDFLRTGRCKYGASCKYRHPPNVQSGGGVKGPINPSEPLYPIRPNEPICQYFMKHGTCKFGQACKFHHPPNLAGIGGGGGTQQSALSSSSNSNQPQHHYHHFHNQSQNAQTQHQIVTLPNGNTVLVSMPVSASQTSATGGNVTGDKNGSPVQVSGGVQILPQRPNESNCIFFLKNGRCKYGATCRYHHPLNYHTDRSSSGRGGGHGGNSGGGTRSMYQQSQQQSQLQQNFATPQVHYVAQLPPGATMQQGHFVVSDGNVTFLALDGNAPANFVSVAAQPQGNNGSGTTIASSTASSSSIASSFETAVSNAADGHDSSSSHWTSPTMNSRRTNMNGGNSYVDMAASGGRSNANQASSGGGAPTGQVNRTIYVQNVGDASSLGLPRVVSASSTIASDPVFYDAGPSPSAWRGARSSSFDHSRSRQSTNLQGGSDDGLQKSTSVHSALDEQFSHNNTRGRPPPGIRSSPRRQSGQVDEGLSMMTSALLTMLDTPAVDTFDESYEYAAEDQDQSLTPRMGTRYYPAASQNSTQGTSSNVLHSRSQSQPYQPMDGMSYYRQTQHSQPDQQHEYPLSLYGGRQAAGGGDGSTLGNLSTHNSLESFQSRSTNESSNGWIVEGNANQTETNDPQQLSPPHNLDNNVGLYLP